MMISEKFAQKRWNIMELLTEIKKATGRRKYNPRFNISGGAVKQIPIKTIKPNPNQPRRIFGNDNLKELADSIRMYGVIQPITVRKSGDGTYELISGERRLRASAMAGLMRIPAIVAGINHTDSALIALIENVQRCDLTFLEEAEAYNRLLTEFGYTQEQLAIKLGKNQSTIANKVRLLKLPEAVRYMIADNRLTERHARALLRLSDCDMQLKAIAIILEKCLNVKQTDELIDSLTEDKPITKVTNKTQIQPAVKDVRIFNNTIKKAVAIMKDNGIKADAKEKEFDDRFEYNIKIYK